MIIRRNMINLGETNKVLIFTDLHAHDFKPFSEPDGGMPSRLKWILAVLDRMLKYAVTERIKHVFFLGDLFHPRTVMKSIVFTKTAEVLRKYSDMGLELHFIPGNHDFIYNSSSAPVVFSELSFIDFADRPTVYSIAGQETSIATVPFRFKDEDLKGDIAALQKEVRTMKASGGYDPEKVNNLLFGHFEVEGAVVTDEYILPSHHNMSEIAGELFRIVFSGHVHRRQVYTMQNPKGEEAFFQFIGTPIQHNFGDGEHFYGFAVYDFSDGTYQMVDTKSVVKVPEFVTVQIREQKDVQKFIKEHAERLTLDYFRFYIYDPSIKMDKAFKSVKFYKVDPMFETSDGGVESEGNDFELQFSMSIENLIDVFIERQKEQQDLSWLDEGKLKTYINQITGINDATN